MPFTEHTDTPDLIERWPYDFQRITPHGDGDPNQYDYLSAFATELRRIDVFIDELYEQRFLESATDRELEKLAAPLGIMRRAEEGDDSLRYRARLGKAIAASDGTAKDIETILGIAFGEDNFDSIQVENVEDAPVIRIWYPSPLIDEIPLTQSELEDQLRRAIPCGHNIELLADDTFLLGEGGDQGIGEGKLV